MWVIRTDAVQFWGRDLRFASAVQSKLVTCSEMVKISICIRSVLKAGCEVTMLMQ